MGREGVTFAKRKNANMNRLIEEKTAFNWDDYAPTGSNSCAHVYSKGIIDFPPRCSLKKNHESETHKSRPFQVTGTKYTWEEWYE